MSLLNTANDLELHKLAQKIYDRHFQLDPELEQKYDDRSKQLMFQDIVYNLGYLKTAVLLEDDKLFPNYASWLFELLCGLMKHSDREQIKDQMIIHYSILSQMAPEIFPVDEVAKAREYLQQAMDVTENAVVNMNFSDWFLTGKHVGIRQDYLHAMLRSNSRGAMQVIENAATAGIPLVEIYEDILQVTMCEVGELWHRNQITVDKEHYCTSITQMVVSRFYTKVFSQPRKGRTILTCCVGSELHEMGGRMLSDLFEYNGWDSVYLGAAVPQASLLNAVKEHAPDLVALSVTMPQYLPLCHEMTMELRKQYPSLDIAVGGRAFQFTNEVWKKWPVDVYTLKASELVQWVEQHLPSVLGAI